MMLSKPVKIFLGLMTVWPLLYFLLFVLFVSLWTLALGGASLRPPAQPGSWGASVMLFLPPLLTLMIFAALCAFYAAHVSRNPRIPPEKKRPWIAIVIVGGPIAQCVYWYLSVWKDAAGRTAARRPPDDPTQAKGGNNKKRKT